MTPANEKVYEKLNQIAKQAEWNRLELVPNDFVRALISLQKWSLLKLPVIANVMLPPVGSEAYKHITRAAIAWRMSQPNPYFFKRPTL